MTATVKLPPALEQQLRAHCAQTGRSLSDVMREALEAHLAAQGAAGPASAFTLGADLFGRHAGPADLAGAYRSQRGDIWESVAASRGAGRGA